MSVSKGFTLVEAMIGLFLIALLSMSSIGAVMSFNNSAYRQSSYVSALALASGELDKIQAQEYVIGNHFRTQKHTTVKTHKSVLDNSSNSVLDIILKTTTEPRANGHLVIIEASYKVRQRSNTVKLVTLVNQFSS